MKKILSFLGLLLILLFGLVGTFLYEPTLYINEKNLKWILVKTKVLKEWSWSEFRFDHQRKDWNDRTLTGGWKNFCFQFDGEAAKIKTCFEEISWDFHLKFSFDEGFFQETLSPIKIRSSFTDFTPGKKKDETSDPPDIHGLWEMIWSDPMPDWDLEWKKITIHGETEPLQIERVSSLKHDRSLTAEAFHFKLEATSKGFTLRAPPSYPLPLEKLNPPLHLRHVVLRGLVEEEGIPLSLTGFLETIKFEMNSFVDLPLKDLGPITEKRALLKTKGKIYLHNVKKNLADLAPPPYNELQAPFNILNGNIDVDLTTENLGENSVLIKSDTHVNLSGSKAALKLNLFTNVPLDLLTHQTGTIALELVLREVLFPLPKLSKKSLPPQFMPDSRIITKPPKPTAKKKSSSRLELELIAEGEKALHIKSNLLDEALRLNFNLKIRSGDIIDGYVSVLPLKTTVFKRPLRVQDLVIQFQGTQKPQLKSEIVFPLPEYKITLTLEGPLDDPRHAFRSEPPLPQNDIFAVLLFGRPMADLDPNDKSSAQKTNQILSQGILSLSVLYFLSGSPVEYVGYNQESQSATAQFGLGKKSSLRVGGKDSGVNEAGLRHSLGKGWYIDTSVQNSSSVSTNPSKNYGVLLERIIAY